MSKPVKKCSECWCGDVDTITSDCLRSKTPHSTTQSDLASNEMCEHYRPVFDWLVVVLGDTIALWKRSDALERCSLSPAWESTPVIQQYNYNWVSTCRPWWIPVIGVSTKYIRQAAFAWTIKVFSGTLQTPMDSDIYAPYTLSCGMGLPSFKFFELAQLCDSVFWLYDVHPASQSAWPMVITSCLRLFETQDSGTPQYSNRMELAPSSMKTNHRS